MQLAMDILQWIAIVLLSYNTHRFMRLQCKFNELQATQNHSVSDMIGGILKCFGTTKTAAIGGFGYATNELRSWHY